MLARGIVILNIILGAMLGYSLVQFVLSWQSPSSQNAIPQSTYPIDNSNNNALDSTQTSVNIANLLESHLFGQKEAVESQVAQIPQALDTQLNLKLHGIFFTPDGHGEFESWAMITHSNGKTGIYNEGSALSMNGNLPLPSGAMLHKIYEKQVILLRNGRYESLRFDENDSKNAIVATADENTGNIASAQNPSQLLGEYQQQLRTRPESLMQLVRIYPVNQSGNFIGYKIKPGHDATVMSQFGLESGDIVTAVNGVTLDSPLKGLGLIQQLATADRIDLQLLRDEQMLSLSFAIEPQ